MTRNKYQIEGPCTACGIIQVVDLDHVTTRGAGGKDLPSNLIPLCRVHHVERHQKGWGHMIKKYIAVKRWMVENGRDDILEKA